MKKSCSIFEPQSIDDPQFWVGDYLWDIDENAIQFKALILWLFNRLEQLRDMQPRSPIRIAAAATEEGDYVVGMQRLQLYIRSRAQLDEAVLSGGAVALLELGVKLL